MAKNYTLTEAAEILAKGTDGEAIADIGRRFPLLAHKLTVVTALAGPAFVALAAGFPEYLTANKVNSALKNGATGGDSIEGEEDEPKGKDNAEEPEEKDEGSDGKDYESMTGRELYNLIVKAGIRKEVETKMGGLKKGQMLEYINKYGLKSADAGNDEAEDTEGDEAEAEEAKTPYDGKSPVDLFKECKKRGIKAAPKKPVKYYIDLLVKNDEATKSKNTDDDDEDDSDWGDDEQEAPVKSKAPAKEKSKAAKKSEPVVEEDDDEDDWDI